MRTWDGSLIPGPIERPEPRTRLQEALEGKQIARVVLDQAPGPTGSPVLGLEFTSGERLVVMAKLDRNSRYRSRLIFRFMGQQKIITPRMARQFSCGRSADPDGTPTDLPELERRLEGAVIRGVRHIIEPTDWGGESQLWELRDGSSVFLATDHAPRNRRYRAELIAQWRQKPDRRIFLADS